MKLAWEKSGKHLQAISLLVLSSVLIIALCSCDNKSKSITNGTRKESSTDNDVKLKTFMSKKGVMYIKDYYFKGGILGEWGSNINVQAIIGYTPNKDVNKIEKVRGIIIEVDGGGRLNITHKSYLDIDEAESVSKALSYMIEELNNRLAQTSIEMKSDYNEVIFITKDEFKVGFYQDKKSLRAFAGSGSIGSATCFFKQGGLVKLKNYIDEGIISAKK